MPSQPSAPSPAPRLGEPLPNLALAQVPRAKLYGYALLPSHADGGPKARLWRAVLAIERDDWRYARDQIISALPAGRISRIRSNSPYTVTYEVVLVICGLNRIEAPLLSAWQLLPEGSPRLVTAFPLV